MHVLLTGIGDFFLDITVHGTLTGNMFVLEANTLYLELPLIETMYKYN